MLKSIKKGLKTGVELGIVVVVAPVVANFLEEKAIPFSREQIGKFRSRLRDI